MSVAYPNQNTVGPSSDSFSASAAFSFDQHNQTQVFGAMNTDPQSQMQNQMPGQIPNQSLSVPMIQVSQAGFTSDYDMGTAPRDEDIDIDLDLDTYDEDEDMGLDDLATPMATAIDDPMDEAANIPASSLLFGQPGPSGAFGRFQNLGQASDDDEMVDDALNQVVNEVMTDAEQPEVPVPFDFQTLAQTQHAQRLRQQQLLQQSLQQPIQQPPQQPQQPQQPLQQIVEQSAEQSQSQTSLPSSQLAPAESSIPNVEAPASSPVKTTPAQEFPTAVEEQTANASSTPFGVEAAQSQPPPSDVQNAEGQPSKEQALETDIAPVAEESSGPATPPPHSSPHTDALKTPQPVSHNSPKHQTPQSSVDPLRISQAETVALENPTPDVNQRDWYTLEGQVASGSPQIPTYPAHQEIPTSPLQGHSGSGSSRPSFPSEPEAQPPHTPHSEHETEREAPSQSSQHLEEQSPHEQAHESAHDEGQNDSAHDDPLLTHPVVVVYRDLEFSLFPISGEKSNLPETSFLPDRSHIGTPLNKLVAALRDVLGEEFTASEELILNFTALGVEFEEENTQMNNFTLYDIIGLFSKLLVQDGVDEVQPLYISLTSRKKYIPKLEMIHSHIVGGGGLASWKDLLASARNQPPSHNHNDNASHKYGGSEDAEKGPYLNEQVPEPSGKTNVADEEHAEGDDDELELEEFEKGLSGDDYYNQQNPLTDVHPATTAVATIDVPKSPSQTILEKQKASFTREASNTDISNVPETQLSQNFGSTPNKKLRLNLSDNSGENSYLKDDEASFVTAQEKQQDTSIAYSGSRSYGFPDSPSSNEEPETETEKSGKDDGLLNFDEHDNLHEEEGEEDHQEEDEKSSSTLHEVPEGESNNQATLQGSGEDGADDGTNWHEWAYTDGDEAENGEYQYGEGHEENSEYVDAAHDLPGDLNEPAEETGNDSEIDPFAYYPEPFDNGDNQGDDEHQGDWEHQSDWEHQDNDEPLLGLDHHETLSTTTSTKRAREEEEDEIEDELSETGEIRDSPTPASKKHKTL